MQLRDPEYFTKKGQSITLLRTSPPSLGRDTLGLGTSGILWGWALWETLTTLGLGSSGTLGLGTRTL